MPAPLLPIGCYDVLPPFARQESALSASLLSVFESFGYEQVAPPLLEYSETLLAGRGNALSAQIFRVMDAHAHKVMGIRADITMQIARIASSRLEHSPRPLRLCYNGAILRMQGQQNGADALHSGRQLTQAGIELIGSASPDADAEIILVAAEALRRAGIPRLSIDLNLPGIVASLLEGETLESEQLQLLHEAIAHKDVSTIRSFAIRRGDSLVSLLQTAGPASSALAHIETLSLPDAARSQCRQLRAVIDILEASSNPDWSLTVDVTENRGLAYHSGISFSIFVPGAAFEVGRGGRYQIDGGHAENMEATGFTFYIETLRHLLPEPPPPPRVYIREGITSREAASLREKGYITVHALSGQTNDEQEAKRQGCSHTIQQGNIKRIRDEL